MNTQKSISSHAAAAKAIRNELKAAFPTVKFSVTSESFSMGDAVRISWVDGCKTEQIEKIVSKYQYGHFNGMEDIYESSNRRNDIPQTKYVTTSRGFSDVKKQEMCETLGIEWSEYHNYNNARREYNYTLVRIELWKTDFTNTPETADEPAPAETTPAPVEAKEKTFVTVTFPDLNKNNTLEENFEAMIMHGTNDVKCWIQKTVELESDEFNEVANSLLENRPEMWEQIGGAWSDAPELENVEYIQMCNSKELTAIFRATCYTPVVEVVETFGGYAGRRFYVNTEGYGYARYVGCITYKNRKD